MPRNRNVAGPRLHPGNSTEVRTCMRRDKTSNRAKVYTTRRPAHLEVGIPRRHLPLSAAKPAGKPAKGVILSAGFSGFVLELTTPRLRLSGESLWRQLDHEKPTAWGFREVRWHFVLVPSWF